MNGMQTSDIEDMGNNPANDIKKYLKFLRAYRRLYLAILGCVVVIIILAYLIIRPQFTATAVIGAPVPSPTTALYSSMSQSIGGGLASKLMGAGGSSDFFSTFQQMLTSDRLTQDLIYKDKVLQEILPDKFPNGLPKENVKPGPARMVLDTIKRTLGRPTGYSIAPILVQKYLDKNFSITQSAPPSGTLFSAFSSNSNTYLLVSIDAYSPETAVNLLKTILNRADANIRNDQLNDLNARIAYINNELNRVTSTAQRDMLINILSNQEQIRMMLVADKHFSYTMVSAPYAQSRPTSPMPLTAAAIRGIVISLALWLALVALAMKSEKTAYKLRRFYRPKKQTVPDEI